MNVVAAVQSVLNSLLSNSIIVRFIIFNVISLLMSNLLRSSLCALLIGTSSLISGQQEKKNPLQTDISIVADQKPYISPNGEYSFRFRKNDYGLKSIGHEVFKNGSFLDAYIDSPDIVKIVKEQSKSSPGIEYLTLPKFDPIHLTHFTLLIQHSKYDAEVDTAFYIVMANHLQKLQDTIHARTNKGLELRAVTGKQDIHEMNVDNKPALYWRQDQWLTVADPKRPVDKSLMEQTRLIYFQTEFKDKGELYSIVMYYTPHDKIKDAPIETFYNDVINSFHVLKK